MSADESNGKQEAEYPRERRAIKTVTLNQIEEAFSKAFTELTGTAYNITILKLDLSENPMDGLTGRDESSMELTLSKSIGKLDSIF